MATNSPELGKTLDVVFQDVLNDADSMCVWVKGLIVTCSILVVTWKVGPPDGHCFLMSPQCCIGSPEMVVFGFFLQSIFSICARLF